MSVSFFGGARKNLSFVNTHIRFTSPILRTAPAAAGGGGGGAAAASSTGGTRGPANESNGRRAAGNDGMQRARPAAAPGARAAIQ